MKTPRVPRICLWLEEESGNNGEGGVNQCCWAIGELVLEEYLSWLH